MTFPGALGPSRHGGEPEFSDSTPSGRLSSFDESLLREHLAWIWRLREWVDANAATDLKTLHDGLHKLIERGRGAKYFPQVLRAEVMDVLQRCGEHQDGLEATSIIRAARSMVHTKPAALPNSAATELATRVTWGPERDLLLGTIRTLEIRNTQLERELQDTRVCQHVPLQVADAPVGADAPVVSRQQNSMFQRFLHHVFGVHRDAAINAPSTFAAQQTSPQKAASRSDGEVDLRTIVLTVHGAANAKSLWEVTNDWSSEKLRTRRAARAWSRGDHSVDLVISTDARPCSFGSWLHHVDAPKHLAAIVDDLRMWHEHWHALGAAWTADPDARDRQRIAGEIASGDRASPIVRASKRIDRLLLEMAQVHAAQAAHAS